MLKTIKLPKSTIIRKNNWAIQALKIKEASPVKVSGPLDAVMAIAANTAGGARKKINWVNLKAISASESVNCKTGFAFSPTDKAATPKIKEKMTICKISPLAMASIILVGKALTSRSFNVILV
jgi:hypothetical protein